jgi:hypothetical protein
MNRAVTYEAPHIERRVRVNLPLALLASGAVA